MSQRNLFVTTALPYANGAFHIGHIMEYIQADIWVRHERMSGNRVHFVGADDVHGAPIMIAAQKRGITPQAFVAEIAAGRKQYLDDIRAQIYEDFGALDVHTVAAGATNDHIDAAYQPMDENAADFEFQVAEFVQQLLALQGVEDSEPVFKRQRISNQTEQVQMVVQEAEWLDRETILRKLPNIDPTEVRGIMERVEEEESTMMGPLMGAAAVAAGEAAPEEAGISPDNVFGSARTENSEENGGDGR